MSDKSIDVNFEDINKKYYTIEEVSKILNIDQSTVAFYFEKLNDFLNITSVGMYQLFDDIDIKNLKIIKDLERNQNMSMKEIRNHLLKNKQEVMLEKESNTQIDKSVLNIFQQFANALIEQNMKIDKMHKTNTQLVEALKILSQNQESIQKELQLQKEINRELLEKYESDKEEQSVRFDSIKNDIAITKEINQKLDEQKNNIEISFKDMSEKVISENKKELKSLKEDIKYINQEELEKYKEKNQSKGLLNNLGKIFNKKK